MQMLKAASVALALLVVASIPPSALGGKRRKCGKCLPGVQCEGFKTSPKGTECKCRCWEPTGECSQKGWKKTKGKGRCNFDPTVPVSPPRQACECPVGIECEGFKFSGTGTHCQCTCWDSEGKCVVDGWKRIKGTGSCDFDPTAPVPAQDPRIEDPCACPFGIECEGFKFSGTGTDCQCTCWDSEGKCAADGWKRIKGTGTCDFDPDVPVPTQDPRVKDPCACPVGIECEGLKFSGTGTHCQCTCWDSEGKCVVDGWKRIKGTGSCDFDPTAPVPAQDPRIEDPCACPFGIECEGFKVSGTGTDCQCTCWDSEGKCVADGWKRIKGTGTCDFDPNVPVPFPSKEDPCACPVGRQCELVKSSGTGTECKCTCWDSEGKCSVSGWQRTKGTGTCDFDPTVPVPVPGQEPRKREPCDCPVGLECEGFKSSATGTDCKCLCWDSEGKCAVNGWQKIKGTGTCDFDPTVPVPAPDPRIKDPCACPFGITCESRKWNTKGTTCRCTCWDAAGKCTPDGWEKTKGKGNCDFAATPTAG